MNHDGGSDGGEGGEEHSELLDQLDYLEDVIQGMRQTIISAGDNEALVANTLVEGNENIRGTIAWLSYKADPMADRLADDLFSLVAGDADEPLGDEVWARFHQKLLFFNQEEVNDEFLKMCLHRQQELEDGRSLIHQVCRRNPPAQVVETLLHIIPTNDDDDGYRNQYHHLSRSDGEYPLRTIMRYGGSLDVVKLLVEADERRQTVDCRLFHALILNKERHRPESFSEILHFLILTVDTNRWSTLLHEERRSEKTPVAMLLYVLDSGGLSMEDILSDDDFIFLLKATCYHYSQTRQGEQPHMLRGATSDDQLLQIERVPLHHAFLVCSPCFDMGSVRGGLEYLASNADFLLKPDVNGDYLIHHIFRSRSYFVLGVSNNMRPQDHILDNIRWSGDCFRKEMVTLILDIAPQCAELTDSAGRSILHMAADAAEMRGASDSDRLDLVRAAWRAYPDAAKIVDKKTGLPPFALAAREEEGQGRKRRRNNWDAEEHSLSSAFFLLREAPEVLSDYI